MWRPKAKPECHSLGIIHLFVTRSLIGILTQVLWFSSTLPGAFSSAQYDDGVHAATIGLLDVNLAPC